MVTHVSEEMVRSYIFAIIRKWYSATALGLNSDMNIYRMSLEGSEQTVINCSMDKVNF